MIAIRFDENISWRIVDAIRAVASATDLKDLALESASSMGEQGTADIDWIARFAGRGGRMFVSGDHNMRRDQHERLVLQSSGLVAVFPPARKWYSTLSKWEQAAYFVAWFPTLSRLARSSPPGRHYRLPRSFLSKDARVEELAPLA